jgi:tetratricopeptide (TPR) repeat protein
MNHYSQARMLFKQGQHQRSIHHFQRYLSHHPDDSVGHLDLAAPLFALGDLAGAEQAAGEATRLEPKNAEAWSTLASIQTVRGQSGTPLRSILAATKLEPKNMSYRVRLGTILFDQGHFDHAVKNFDLILGAEPRNLDAIAGKAAVLERTGLYTVAMGLLEPVIQSAPAHPQLGTIWGTVCRRLGHQDAGIDVIVRMLGTPMNATASSMLLAELGALYDAQGQVDAAFEAYTQANQRRHGPWEPSQLEAHVDRLISTFSTEFFERAPRGADATGRPILIVGMPRSGTSLVEQILSAHPDVHGAGELEDLRASSLIAEQLLDGSFPASLTRLDQSTVDHLGQWYLSRCHSRAPSARFVTDKMPQNFQMLGLAALTMPGVRIIHCVRDPLDTALSCYFQGFKFALAWSNRLDWLGAYLTQYRRLMAHWERVLPIPIHTVRYEALVANPEPEIREMLAQCGIPFDAAVLSHHRSGRQVATASYAQANKPIYTSSAGRAKRYAHHLAPITVALESA